MPLSLDQARTILAATRAKGREMGRKPISVIVIDAGGHPLAFEREDGAPVGRFSVALGKAYGAVMFGAPSSRLAEMADARPQFVASLANAYDGKLIPAAGGVLIRDEAGATLGAVGVTGDTSENDAEEAMAGIAAAGLTGEA